MPPTPPTFGTVTPAATPAALAEGLALARSYRDTPRCTFCWNVLNTLSSCIFSNLGLHIPSRIQEHYSFYQEAQYATYFGLTSFGRYQVPMHFLGNA